MEMTATQIARELDISRSYLYYLKNNHAFTVEVDENGRPVWNREVLEAIRRVLAERKVPAKEKKSPTGPSASTTGAIWGTSTSS